jgi:hypothetical protein
MELVRYSGSSDWSALYVDGELDKVGDHYVIDERISALLQVDVRDSDAFMQGGNDYSDVAKTLDEIEQFETGQSAAEQLRAELLAQAAILQAKAAELTKQANGKG